MGLTTPVSSGVTSLTTLLQQIAGGEIPQQLPSYEQKTFSKTGFWPSFDLANTKVTGVYVSNDLKIKSRTKGISLQGISQNLRG